MRKPIHQRAKLPTEPTRVLFYAVDLASLMDTQIVECRSRKSATRPCKYSREVILAVVFYVGIKVLESMAVQ